MVRAHRSRRMRPCTRENAKHSRTKKPVHHTPVHHHGYTSHPKRPTPSHTNPEMSDASSQQRFMALTKDFTQNSHEVLPSYLSRYQHLMTFALVILSFAAVALALLNKNSSAAKYFASAVVASFSIGLSSVYACNFFGVYI